MAGVDAASGGRRAGLSGDEGHQSSAQESAPAGASLASCPATSGCPPLGSIIHSCQVFGKGLISHQQPPETSPSHGSPAASAQACCPQHRLSVAVLTRSWDPCPGLPSSCQGANELARVGDGPGPRARAQKGFTCRADVAAGPCTPPVLPQCPGSSCPGASLQHQAACCTWPSQLWQCDLDVFSASGRTAGLTSRLPKPVLWDQLCCPAGLNGWVPTPPGLRVAGQSREEERGCLFSLRLQSAGQAGSRTMNPAPEPGLYPECHQCGTVES